MIEKPSTVSGVFQAGCQGVPVLFKAAFVKGGFDGVCAGRINCVRRVFGAHLMLCSEHVLGDIAGLLSAWLHGGGIE